MHTHECLYEPGDWTYGSKLVYVGDWVKDGWVLLAFEDDLPNVTIGGNGLTWQYCDEHAKPYLPSVVFDLTPL